MADLVPIKRYARLRNVTQHAIQEQIARGTIRLVDGKVDIAQADASWGLIRRTRNRDQVDDDVGQRSARSKVLVAQAKLRLHGERFAAQRERYVERTAAIKLAREEADLVLRTLRRLPADQAGSLAAELDIEREQARLILQGFVKRTLAELGDLRQQAVRDVERA
jgi:hypothetical protein